MKRNLKRNHQRRATKVTKNQLRLDRNLNRQRYTFRNASLGEPEGTRVIINLQSEKQLGNVKLSNGMTIKVVADPIWV